MGLFSLILYNFIGTRLFVQECPVFLRGEENFSATPCRNFFFAMRLEGCKEFLNLSMIFQGTAKGYCSTHFLQLQMQMQIFSECVRWGGAVI